MKHLWTISTLALALVASAWGQGNNNGGGPGAGQVNYGGQGGGGMGGGVRQESYDNSVRGIEAILSLYLNGDETKNILTPSEYSEWSLNLKVGQVVIAEARSEAFDPALEVVDTKNKVLASNDDRYPGDQRPLLLWRCTQDGAYNLRVRCFHDKSGGQFFVRFRVFDTVELDPDKMVDKKLDRETPYLIRVPMKAGQLKQVLFENPDFAKYVVPRISAVISPIGLPDRDLAQQINSGGIKSIIAPLDGDYYCLTEKTWRDGSWIRVGMREIVPATPTQEGTILKGTGKIGTPSLWKVKVKAGDLIELSTPELHFDAQMGVWEEPNFAAFDLKKPENNPFFPKVKKVEKVERGENDEKTEPEALTFLRGRDRDRRIQVCAVSKDTTLWVYSNGFGQKAGGFTLSVHPAAAKYVEGKRLSHHLIVGKTDYWEFNAKVGDVMTFDVAAKDFATQVQVWNPELAEVISLSANPDQASVSWTLTAQQPGRYLVGISAIGDGGGGEYSLARKVYPAKEFGKGSPAKGELADGDVHVWKFTATPDQPLIIHQRASTENVMISYKTEAGTDQPIPMTPVDGTNFYGILHVLKPTTFLVVITGLGVKDSYLIDFSDIPGYVKVK